MTTYAKRTNLGDSRRLGGKRYLWTDAFAVCTLEGLAAIEEEEARDANEAKRLHQLALALIDDVHDTLGRYRPDDGARAGTWLSGLSESDGRAHPTKGGLRIGKLLPERGARERYDADLEWERDGQYFHYLTKWMHALDVTARRTGDIRYELWACELAVAAERAFVRGGGREDPPEQRQMVWKMSADLSRPLISSMGQHDPLDGYVTCRQLEATSPKSLSRELVMARQTFAELMIGRSDVLQLTTSDPLGLGGLFFDAHRLIDLQHHDEPDEADAALITRLLRSALLGLEHYVDLPDLRLRAEHRLAFRELGLAIGLSAMEMTTRHEPKLTGFLPENLLEDLADHFPLREEIESFWLEPHHQRAKSWQNHRDINDVMLATSLVPDGFVSLSPPFSRTEESTWRSQKRSRDSAGLG